MVLFHLSCVALVNHVIIAAILVVSSPFPVGADLVESVWVSREDMDAVSKARLPRYCKGAYLERDYPQPLDIDSSVFPVRAAADRIRHSIGETSDIEGEVIIEQGNRRITTVRAALDERARTVSLAWGALLSEPGIALGSESGQVDLDAGSARFEDADFVLFTPEVRGIADVIHQSKKGLSLENVRFTRCEPGSNTWEVSSGKFTVDDGAVYGHARNALVKIKGVPIFYTPYLRVPVTDARQSGFLFPSLGYSSEDGVDLAFPYYLNLAPNYDATVTPRHISNRGTGLELEFRHKSRFADTELGGAYLANDDTYGRGLSRDDFFLLNPGESFAPADRWLANVHHRGRFGDVSTYVNYTATSDIDYFRDLGVDLEMTSRDHLQQRGDVEYRKGGTMLRISSRRFQMLDDVPEPYRRAPEVYFSYASDLVGALGWSLESTWSSFDRPNEPFSGYARVVGRRVHIEPRLQLPMSRSWGFLTFGAGYRYTAYDLRDVPVGGDTKPERGVAFGDFDAGLYFERDVEVGKSALIQTFEPRLYYLYQSFEAQDTLPSFDSWRLGFSFSQIFRDNRFSGLDRIGDANQLGVGFTNRLIRPETGTEILRFNFGTIVYFDDRRVTLAGTPTDADMYSSSEIVGDIVAWLGSRFVLTSNFTWDPLDAEEDEAAFSLRYRRDNRRIFNIGHRFHRGSQIDQSNVAFVWSLSRHWSAIGRWNYNFKLDRTNEVFFGFEYANCCWQARILYSRFTESPGNSLVGQTKEDEGVLFQFVFRGMAGLGTRVESLIARGVTGYLRETRQ
jgi:LPS-assembly protein